MTQNGTKRINAAALRWRPKAAAPRWRLEAVAPPNAPKTAPPRRQLESEARNVRPSVDFFFELNENKVLGNGILEKMILYESGYYLFRGVMQNKNCRRIRITLL